MDHEHHPPALLNDILVDILWICVKNLDWPTYCALRGSCRELAAVDVYRGMTTRNCTRKKVKYWNLIVNCYVMIDDIKIAKIYIALGYINVRLYRNFAKNHDVHMFSHTANHLSVSILARDVWASYVPDKPPWGGGRIQEGLTKIYNEQKSAETRGLWPIFILASRLVIPEQLCKIVCAKIPDLMQQEYGDHHRECLMCQQIFGQII